MKAPMKYLIYRKKLSAPPRINFLVPDNSIARNLSNSWINDVRKIVFSGLHEQHVFSATGPDIITDKK